MDMMERQHMENVENDLSAFVLHAIFDRPGGQDRLMEHGSAANK
jgi:hypothetical protein